MTDATYSLHLPTASRIDIEASGRGGDVASKSVFRIVCQDRNSSGTGFLHRSGLVITAAHVVNDSQSPLIILQNGTSLEAETIAKDDDIDIALLKPAYTLPMTVLSLSMKEDLPVGTKVSTWGFPGGYQGLSPMLSVGYLAGNDAWQTQSGLIITRSVVNAAFNCGNSGGPLLNIDTGDVIGVVSSKLAPLSPVAHSILKALETQSSGFVYTATLPDGSTETFSEGQLVGQVLNELRGQIQLVIGYAIIPRDIKTFLKASGIDS